MDKEILERGYITHAITDENGRVYGITESDYPSFEAPGNENKVYYWSEVYCEPGFMAGPVIRKGTLLANATSDELKNYFKQSVVNLSK